MRKIFKVLLFLFIAFAVIVVFATSWYHSMLKPLDPHCGGGCATKQFTIASSESTDSIAKRLEEEELIKNSLALKIYLQINRLGGGLKAGMHELSSGQSVAEIVDILTDSPSAETFSLTFLPGGTLRDVRQRIIDAGYGEAEVDAALAKTYDNPILSSRPAGASLEGYIWGDTYEFYTTATPEDIISRALTEFESIISRNNLESAFASRGLSLHEAITLASIIQKESYAPDMPQVAQVFLLRLERSIPLGSDAVIAYAADQENPDRDKTDMSYLTAFGCPWNSRTCTGLPPSPISNPGLSALESVANPASGEYLYFLTGDDGKMYYAYTEEEHLQNRVHCPELCKYL